MRKRRHRGTRRQAHATELSERRCPGQPRVSQSQCRILAAGTAPGTCQERGQSLWSEGRNTSFALPTQAATTLPPSCPDPELSTTCVCRLAPSVLGPHRSLPPPSSLGTQKSSSQHYSGPATLHSPPCYLSRRLSACSVFKDTAATPSRGFKTPTPQPILSLISAVTYRTPAVVARGCPPCLRCKCCVFPWQGLQ